MRSARFFTILVGVLAGIVIAGHVLGANVLKGTMWGMHFYGFFPPAVMVTALAAIFAAGVWLDVHIRRATEPGAGNLNRWKRLIVEAVLSLAAFVLFWLFRIRHTLLGDAGVLSENLPLGEQTHPRQPLSLLIHHYSYIWLRSLFAPQGREPKDVAYDSVALGSAVAGALFIPVALAIARRVVAPPRAGDHRIDLAPTDQSASIPSAPLVAGLLIGQGYSQLFFGYVENYTWFTLALGIYLGTGMSFVAGRSPLILALLAITVAIGLNLSGVAMLPSLGVLVAWGLTRPSRRAGVVRDLLVTAAVVLGLERVLALQGTEYNASRGLRYMWDVVVIGHGGDNSIAYVLSRDHLRDFFNIHLLIGPFAAFVLVPLALHRAFTRSLRDPTLAFVLGCAVPALVASWLLGDPLQGFPRDWDLFAPFALCYTTAGAYMITSAPLPGLVINRLLSVALMVSLFHSGSWVGINTSFDRSFERMQDVPVSRGRNELAVGYWYLTHGLRPDARLWFERAIQENPGNNGAHYYLGLMAIEDDRYEDAARHFSIALQVRPDKTNYRLGLVDALVLAGHPDRALPEIERLIQAEPARPNLWGCYGIALLGVGRTVDAGAAFERASALAPGEPRFARLRAGLGRPNAYQTALREDWDYFVVSRVRSIGGEPAVLR